MPEIQPKDVQILPIGAETTVVRSRTWNRLKFEIEYALQRGTTVNSYLIQADRVALFDPPGESFTEIFLKALTNHIDLKQIDYVILGHVNSNRGVTLKALVERSPNLTFVCSNLAANALKDIFPDQELKVKVAEDEESLDLGRGHNLKFASTPNPFWTDGLCTYDPLSHVLFTDKLFGAHIYNEQLYDKDWAKIEEDRRYYYDCLMAPNARQVETALDKLKSFEAKIYAPAHGPLVFYSLMSLTQSYRQWCEQQKGRKIKVVLIYASAYGNTATLAQALGSGITKAGVELELINCEVTEADRLRQAIKKADGFIIGSPTLGGHAPTPIQTALGIVLSTANKTKLAGVFGSYGWSGEAIDLLSNKLRNAGYEFGFEPIRVKFAANDKILKFCEETGTDFAQKLKKAKTTSLSKQSGNNSQAVRTEQAVARISSPLSVVTAKKGELSGAMLADWISQATFTPPGLTVSIAKERAIESLMHVGNNFVVNFLEEGKHLGLMRHFIKPFEPGEDRFSGLNTEAAENGCFILTDSLAYLECTVEKRIECGDYWLVYAVVNNGQLLNSEGKTAVLHRHSGLGSYY